MDIRALTPDLAEDFFAFFDHRAFSDNPSWKNCYCTFFHHPERIPEAEAKRRPPRREQARAFIRDGILRGYLAYDGGQVVGWCNANRRSAFPRFGEADASDEGGMSVVCFVIDPHHRHRGIARALLERVLADAAAAGYRWVEAYPAPRARTAGGHFHGPPALYESLGFLPVPERKGAVRRLL